VGSQVHGAASQPGGAGVVQLQVRHGRAEPGVIEEIIENSGTPYFCFKDIDENKPAGSIKIRIEMISYFLRRYQDRINAKQARLAQIERQLAGLTP
jgi:hypothetical protein